VHIRVITSSKLEVRYHITDPISNSFLNKIE
jgi:hypothetical protein